MGEGGACRRSSRRRERVLYRLSQSPHRKDDCPLLVGAQSGPFRRDAQGRRVASRDGTPHRSGRKGPETRKISHGRRKEEGRVGKKGGSTGTARWSQEHRKKKKH